VAPIPFDNIISRADALPLIPEETVDEVIKAAAAESAALSRFRRVNMGTKHSTLPVLSALAQAYFVAGDTGLKQTTEMAWAGITLEAEELAAFVRVPEAVVDDIFPDSGGPRVWRPIISSTLGLCRSRSQC
jgi:HK97 family phage major capsid protein